MNNSSLNRPSERHVILKTLGRGRQAEVFLALDTVTGCNVALKKLDPILLGDTVSMKRFQREFDVLEGITHPGVVRVFEFHLDALGAGFSMELCPGGTLEAQGGRMDASAFARQALRLAEALQACHAKGVLHRDIKPSNILLDAKGDFTLSDFGVAAVGTLSSLTRTGALVGTPETTAPECFLGSDADTRSDIYALGCCFHFMATGRLPFSGVTLQEMLARHAQGSHLDNAWNDVRVSQNWTRLITRMMSTHPQNRPQSARELCLEMHRLIEGDHKVRPSPLRLVRSPCFSCGAARIASLPWCSSCGASQSDVFQEGNVSIVLERADDGGHVLADLVERLPRGVWTSAIPLERLRRFPNSLKAPRLLMKELSKPSADMVEALVLECGGIARGVTSLPRQFRLSPLALLLPVSFTLMSMVLDIAVNPVVHIGVCLVTLSFVAVTYLKKTSPLLKRSQKIKGASMANGASEWALAEGVRKAIQVDISNPAMRDTFAQMAAHLRPNPDLKASGRILYQAHAACVRLQELQALRELSEIHTLQEKCAAARAASRPDVDALEAKFDAAVREGNEELALKRELMKLMDAVHASVRKG